MSNPRTILQFGTGRFLRAFIGAMAQQANEAGDSQYRIVAVQSTSGPRADLLNANDAYTVQIRGLDAGETIDCPIRVGCTERAIVAAEDWSEVLHVARRPELAFITSNTTEASYALDHTDTPDENPPRSFPAKLTRCLLARFAAGLPGAVVAPCELVERNGEALRNLVLDQAKRWRLDDAFLLWLQNDCAWLCSMVDRMVVPPKPDDPLAQDELSAIAEPFCQWLIERISGREIPFMQHPAIEWVADVDAMFLRKVRILNGAHTAMVSKYLARGYETVQDVMRDSEAADWVRGLIFDEVIPCIDGRVEGAESFARQTLDRLANPFFEHKLRDIAMGHEAKVDIRLRSTYNEYIALNGKEPERIAEAIREAEKIISPS